jgi:hypothetical protein
LRAQDRFFTFYPGTGAAARNRVISDVATVLTTFVPHWHTHFLVNVSQLTHPDRFLSYFWPGERISRPQLKCG